MSRPNPPPTEPQAAHGTEVSSERVQHRAQAARLRTLERALRQERTAHIAIATVVLDTADNPERFVARIEALARAVVRDKKTPRATKDAVLAARDLFRRTVEQRTGRPQQLFDPDVGHVLPRQVERIAAMDAPQLSLDDARDVHRDRIAADAGVQARVLDALRAADRPLTDVDLWGLIPELTQDSVYNARVALHRAGRLVRDVTGNHPTYALLERTLA